MSLTQRVFSDAFRDMHRAMNAFDQAFFNNMGLRSAFGSSNSLFSTPSLLDSQFNYPATDLVEKPDAYELNAELPGYDKNNIKIELADSRTLVLRGHMNEEKESSSSPAVQAEVVSEANGSHDATVKEGQIVSKDENGAQQQLVQQQANNKPQFWFKERMSGSFSRSFSFPTPIDPESIKAAFNNDVLKVTIPKTSESRSTQINIE